MAQYEYLYDFEVLKEIDNLQTKTQYTRIIVLDKVGNVKGTIEGRATGGSISLNGSSAVRRTGSLQMVADEENYKILDIQNIIAINKEIILEVGIKNTLNKYSQYPIFWFPLGHYIVSTASITHGLQGLNISMNLKDLMAKLNGEEGGTFTTSVIHSPIDVMQDDGTTTREDVLIYNLIFTLVNEWGEIPADRIIIDDIDLRIKNAVRWVGKDNVYGYYADTEEKYYALTLTPPSMEPSQYDTYEFNDTIGYQYTDFTYPSQKDFTSNAGETIVSALDKIKNAIGNYEYFFDIDGIFHFQAIKNYLNEGSAEINLSNALNDKYLLNESSGKSVYQFNNANLISSFSNNPQWNNIKNDIVVWGKRGDNGLGIRYHLVIDTPEYPDGTEEWTGRTYTDSFGVLRAINKEIPGSSEQITFTATDWRQKIYLDYVLDGIYHRYAKELEQEWPKIYDIVNNKFFAEQVGEDSYQIKVKMNAMNYFLDAIDPERLANPAGEAFRNLSISKIGKRDKVISDDQINTLFAPVFPNIVYVEAGAEDTSEQRQEAVNNGDAFSQVSSDLYNALSIGSANNAAFDLIRSQLHEITSYNENITVQCMPIYYLEPNTRITVHDEESSIHGDYMIKSISIPLALNGTMDIQASKAIERI